MARTARKITKKIKEISVFFPAYNLENQITDTVEKAYQVVPKLASKYEIIVINDGSKDETGKTLTKLKKKYKTFKVITHKKNKGYGGALKSGFYGSKHEWICFTDGDGQFDISDLPELITKQRKTNSDAVIGYYLGRKVSKSIIITSKIWEMVVFLLFGLKVKDIDCGFKLLRKEIFDTIPRLESERGAFISSELLIKTKKAGFKIAEVGVSHSKRDKDKKSATGRDWGVIINSFKDLFKLWRELN